MGDDADFEDAGIQGESLGSQVLGADTGLDLRFLG